jgi:Cu(I)/Ag(I) efflux system membrane protein CusA/SilA
MSDPTSQNQSSVLSRVIAFFLDNRLLVFIAIVFLAGWGLYVAPFDYSGRGWPTDPVPVDAIPDIGENQQIVFTKWAGRSPQDVEDQVTYPLTVTLLGLPGVKTIRSYSYFGFSTIYVVFDDEVEFYWSRSRVLEKLNSLSPGTLPANVRPTLGPDATALGQVFWYTVEGQGFDLHELRSIQDFTVRYALLSVDGVAEVASIGGYVREYQVDVDPDAMRVYGVKLSQVVDAVRRSNIDVGARTIEVNRVEYVVRGVGFLKSADDLEKAVIESRDNVPVMVGNVARVALGPASRRGALDKEGAEVVGGVVVVRYGENPLQVINAVKEKISEISPGLPRRMLSDGSRSQVAIVPFYDRSGLIHETLGTLEEALTHEILITIIVVLVMVLHFRSSILISGLLPLAVLMSFIAMKLVGVDSNIMSLSGIAIAVGTIVDMGIIVTENILRHVRAAPGGEDLRSIVQRATNEVGGAVVTAISTTVVSFLPVFAMIGAEGKLFRPLAFTKTFALLGSVIVAIVILPTLATLLLGERRWSRLGRYAGAGVALAAGLWLGSSVGWLFGAVVIGFALYHGAADRLPGTLHRWAPGIGNLIAAIAVAVLLTRAWLPLGPDKGPWRNLLFVALLVGGVLLLFRMFLWRYESILRVLLRHKLAFSAAPLLLVLVGACAWLGFDRVFTFVPAALARVGIDEQAVRDRASWARLSKAFPGLGREFMPPLDEGSFLLMPTTMPHASIGESQDQLQKMDMAIRAIPEVESVVGKLGRADSPLDPAPISMFETVITYKSEFLRDPTTGRRVVDDDGKPIRQWREHIRGPDDIWDEILLAAEIPGMTSAPKLQPIAARIVMLQSGMRAPMGVKVQGQSLQQIEQVGLEIERLLKQVPDIKAATVVADRVVGKPYLEIEIDREAIARYGVNIQDVQDVIEIAIGGKTITQTVEGRERYPVRVRYMRELRDSIESLDRILVPAPDGAQIPITQLASLHYQRGPQVIKAEDTFLVGYVVFDKQPGSSEVDVVEAADAFLRGKIASGELQLPPGSSYSFSGSYEHQVRSAETLKIVLPVALLIIFLILYLQFRSVITTGLVFSGIIVAWAGGFILLWLYGQSWFLDFAVFGVNMRDLFSVHAVNLSVAVWVGFLALFGIATDDGVVMATYLDQSFRARRAVTIEQIREATVAAATRRIRPSLMTSATTILALVPVLSSTGRGADVMVPMAIPSVGGILIVLISLFVVPVAYCAVAEFRLRRATASSGLAEARIL